MQTIIILIHPERLKNADTDLAYEISDTIEKITKGAVTDNGYDYLDSDDGSIPMGIWLNADNAEIRWKEVADILKKEDFMGNDVSEASEIYISDEDTADIEDCEKVYSGF
ncbi:MAG: hypothetical protein E7505_09755 [Ruminococcus sp.]|nr:hypothetical protein [Ruminococcus sp.]